MMNSKLVLVIVVFAVMCLFLFPGMSRAAPTDISNPVCGFRPMVERMLKGAGAEIISRSVSENTMKFVATNRYGAFWVIEAYKSNPKVLCILAYVGAPGSNPA